MHLEVHLRVTSGKEQARFVRYVHLREQGVGGEVDGFCGADHLPLKRFPGKLGHLEDRLQPGMNGRCGRLGDRDIDPARVRLREKRSCCEEPPFPALMRAPCPRFGG